MTKAASVKLMTDWFIAFMIPYPNSDQDITKGSQTCVLNLNKKKEMATF